MLPFKHETIKQVGLQTYLDSERQMKRHGGKGYSDFVAMLTNGATKSHIKREMKVVSPNTINAWISLYRAEQGIEKI